MSLVFSDEAVRNVEDKGDECFFIDRFEVTNKAFQDFLIAAGYRPENRADSSVFLAHWDQDSTGVRVLGQGINDYPVVFVNHDDAAAYARHAGKMLPSRDQWLAAALGKAGRKPFPWGDQFMPFYCNSWRSGVDGPARVGTFEQGRSDWGCYDMVGNVAEWSKTPINDVVEPSFFILGGSWTDGGNPEVEEEIFNLLDFKAYAEEASRNNTLGFRCVRNNALAYVRNKIVPTLASLTPDEKSIALNELTAIHESVYKILKGFEFESRIAQRLSTPSTPALIAFQEEESSIVLCFDDGSIRAISLKGDLLWDWSEKEKDLSCRFMTVPGDQRLPGRIVVHGWLRSHLRVLDARKGRSLWRIGGVGTVRHVFHVPEIDGTTRGLLVDWHLEDRHENFLFNRLIPADSDRDYSIGASSLVDIVFQRIDYFARALLSREALQSPLRDQRLSFFIEDPENLEIEDESLFCVDRFGGGALYLGLEVHDRFWIQLVRGGYNNVEAGLASGNRLVFYDLDTGEVRWSIDYPAALFDFYGVIRKEPLLLHDGKRVAVLLEEDPDPTGPDGRSCLCLLNMHDGSIAAHFSLSRGEKLTGLVSLDHPSLLLAAVIDSRELFFWEEASTGDLRSHRLSPEQLIGFPGSMRILTGQDASASYPYQKTGAIPPILELLTGPKIRTPWILTETDQNGYSLLFAGHDGEQYQHVYLMQGLFNHHAHFSIPDPRGGKHYLWLWDSLGNLFCFEGGSGSFLWSTQAGNLSNLPPALSDLNGDGSPEGIITSHSGELMAFELTSGRRVLDLDGRGRAFAFVLPLDIDQDKCQELMIGLQEGDGLILDGVQQSRTEWERQLYESLDAFAAWKNGKQGR